MRHYKTFTQAQMRTLAQWEPQFRSVVKSRYLRGVGKSSAGIIAEVYREATGKAIPVNANCSKCIFNLLEEVGRAYFEEQEWQASKPRKVADLVEEETTDKDADNGTEK